MHNRDREPLWVLDDPTCPAGAACIAVAERLGVEIRRIRLSWNWRGLIAASARRGSLAGLAAALPLQQAVPAMTLSAGRRAGAVAAWLSRTVGSRMIHVGPPPRAAGLIDLHVVDQDADATPDTLPSPGSTLVVPTLGLPHRLSPLALLAAGTAWRERLDHLPQPSLALLLGSGPFGSEMQPSEAFRLAAALAGAVAGSGGVILAWADRRAGREALDAFGAGLADCLHVLHRSDEPDADPSAGFLASAAAVVVAGHAPVEALRACATTAPVYLAPCGPVSPMLRRLHLRLFAADQARPLASTIEGWPRTRLDEAGRVAAAIQAQHRIGARPSTAADLLAPFPISR